MVKVVLSADASRFARRESNYLRNRSLRASQRFTQNLRTARQRLALYPEFGPSQQVSDFPTLRRMVVGAYVLDYLLGDPIRIVGIRHGRQAPPDWDGNRLLDDD